MKVHFSEMGGRFTLKAGANLNTARSNEKFRAPFPFAQFNFSKLHHN
jgi:hypothetical protein